MTRLDLPDGEWAELCAPGKVSERRRRALLVATADINAATADIPKIPGAADANGFPGPDIPDPAHMTGSLIEAQYHMFDLLILCFVKTWSLTVPVSLESVEDLDTGTKDVLTRTCLPLMTEMLPDYSPDVDPKARTFGSTPPPPVLSAAEQELSTILSSGNTS